MRGYHSSVQRLTGREDCICNFMFEKTHCGTVQMQRVPIETNQYHVSSAEGVLVYLNFTTANTDHLKTLSFD